MAAAFSAKFSYPYNIFEGVLKNLFLQVKDTAFAECVWFIGISTMTVTVYTFYTYGSASLPHTEEGYGVNFTARKTQHEIKILWLFIDNIVHSFLSVDYDNRNSLYAIQRGNSLLNGHEIWEACVLLTCDNFHRGQCGQITSVLSSVSMHSDISYVHDAQQNQAMT